MRTVLIHPKKTTLIRVALFFIGIIHFGQANAMRCMDLLAEESSNSSAARPLEKSISIPRKEKISGLDPEIMQLSADLLAEGLQSDLAHAANGNFRSILKAGEVQVDGKLGETIFDDDGHVAYLRYIGPTRFLNSKSEEISGHGVDTHRDGFSTAIGLIKQIKINGRDAPTPSFSGIRTGDQVEILYSSGVRVRGKFDKSVSFTLDKPAIVTLLDCTVNLGSRILYKPTFGPYDFILSERVDTLRMTDQPVELNSKLLANFYKSDVGEIKKDPLLFFREVQDRFHSLKREGKDPYGFAFEEGRPVVSYMLAEIANRISSYESKGLFWRPRERNLANFYKLFGLSFWARKQEKRLKIELEFLRAIQGDIKKLANSSELAYNRLLNTSSDFLLVMQGTQSANPAAIRTFIYEFYHRSTVKNLAALFEEYKSGTLQRFGNSRYAFAVTRNQMFDPQELRVLIVPVVGFLLASDLVANRNVPVHYATVNGETVGADGFLQDPMTLFLHDIRFHAGKRESHDDQYFRNRKMTSSDISDFRTLQNKWIQDFIVAVRKEPDQKMRTAIFQAVQTITHDRGMVFAPSTFNQHRWRNYYFIMKGEIYVTVWGQPNRGIGLEHSDILPYMAKAYDWVNQYWLDYKDSVY